MPAWRWRRFFLNIFDIIAHTHAHIDLFCAGTFVYPGANLCILLAFYRDILVVILVRLSGPILVC
jgi:hypothetical protein